jgi:hypothetical protein
MKASRKSQSHKRTPPAPLTFYSVDKYGTITDPRVRTSSIRSDVFENISSGSIHTTDQLVDAVQGCSPLAVHFSGLADTRLSEIEQELDDDDNWLGLIERRRLVILAAQLRHDPDTGWRDWVTHEGDPGLASFKELIQDWLDDDINWDESDWFDNNWSGQSASLHFFTKLDREVRKSLGVVIIEGEHPGSSYYAAELKGDIVQANQAAQELGLDFRFRAEGDSVPVAPAPNPVPASPGDCS